MDPGRLQICPELPTGSCSRLGLAACSVASRSKGHLQSNTDHEVVPPAESRLGTEEGVFGVFPRRCGPVSLDLESQPIHVCPYHSPRHTATVTPPRGVRVANRDGPREEGRVPGHLQIWQWVRLAGGQGGQGALALSPSRIWDHGAEAQPLLDAQTGGTSRRLGLELDTWGWQSSGPANKAPQQRMGCRWWHQVRGPGTARVGSSRVTVGA